MLGIQVKKHLKAAAKASKFGGKFTVKLALGCKVVDRKFYVEISLKS
jgi:hypothetical protein